MRGAGLRNPAARPTIGAGRDGDSRTEGPAMHRLLLVCAVPLLCALASPALAQPGGPGAGTYDLVIANGRVIDPESGLDAVRSIGIRGARIGTVADGPLQGAGVIAAAGLVAAPGCRE